MHLAEKFVKLIKLLMHQLETLCRGLASPHDAEHIHTTVKQILANSTHSWSEKTLRHFPSLLREMLKGREDVRGTSVLSEWQKVNLCPHASTNLTILGCYG